MDGPTKRPRPSDAGSLSGNDSPTGKRARAISWSESQRELEEMMHSDALEAQQLEHRTAELRRQSDRCALTQFAHDVKQQQEKRKLVPNVRKSRQKRATSGSAGSPKGGATTAKTTTRGQAVMDLTGANNSSGEKERFRELIS
jgi:hypothetical protein